MAGKTLAPAGGVGPTVVTSPILTAFLHTDPQKPAAAADPAAAHK